MCGDSESEDEGFGIDYSLHTAISELDDGYECLTEIQVTPRHPPTALPPVQQQMETGFDEEQEPSKPASNGSESSFSLSTGSSSMRFRKEPPSVVLFLSSLAKGWYNSSSGSDTKGHSTQVSPRSPASILERRCSGIKGSKSIEMSAAEEKQLLHTPIFRSIDGPDACEFREFLRDHEGERHRTPVLCLVDYGGHGSHASDIWVLMHNTIRRELFDVFEMLDIIRQTYYMMTLNDIYDLRKWWRFFVILWAEFETYDRSSLEPIVQQICLVDGRSDVLTRRLGSLREMREWLGLKMEEITSYIEEFEKLPAGRALCLFCKTVDAFGDRAMIYFGGVERLLPRFVESYHGEEIKSSIESQLIERVRQGSYFAEFVVAIVRWMGTVQGISSAPAQAKEREKWLNRNLYWLERQNLPKYFRKYEASHGRVLGCFRDLLKKSGSL